MYPPNTSRRSVLESLPAELTLLAVGVLLGTLGGYALSRVLASRMYGVTPVDPATYIMAIAGFAAVAALASAIPARSATRVDPIENAAPGVTAPAAHSSEASLRTGPTRGLARAR